MSSVHAAASLADIIAAVSAIIALTSGVVAYFSIIVPRRAQKSLEMRDQAVLSLDRAYQVLTGCSAPGEPPAADRLSWLTAARLLVQYQRLKGKVVLEEHKLVLEEQEEYWRHRFDLLLQPTSAVGVSYFSGPRGQAGIYLDSAVVVYRFARWPEGKADPIDDAVGDVDVNEAAFKGFPSLREFLVQSGKVT